MNIEITDQTNTETAVYLCPDPSQKVKHCTICQTELRTVPHIHYTSFGLQLCEDCLYL